MIADPFHIVALEWDEWLRSQPQLSGFVDERLNLNELRNRSRLWARGNALASLRLRLAKTATSPRQVTLIGSGDFHYASLLLLEGVARVDRPVSLVLFDNHPDWFSHHPRHHCGNWVWSALRLPGVSDVTIIGPSSSDLAWHKFYFAPLGALREARLRLVPMDMATVRIPGAGRLTFDTFQTGGAARAIERLAGRDVYVSVDKDCLRAEDASTDWDAGRLTLSELAGAVRQVANACTIVGADITGERSASSLQGLFRRLDAGRLRERPALTTAEAQRNQTATFAVLRAIGALHREASDDRMV
ncbi:MAG: arginase [Phycisphaerales bacterium]|nr:arginase [Phycisphaerales bacterium]